MATTSSFSFFFAVAVLMFSNRNWKKHRHKRRELRFRRSDAQIFLATSSSRIFALHEAFILIFRRLFLYFGAEKTGFRGYDKEMKFLLCSFWWNLREKKCNEKIYKKIWVIKIILRFKLKNFKYFCFQNVYISCRITSFEGLKMFSSHPILLRNYFHRRQTIPQSNIFAISEAQLTPICWLCEFDSFRWSLSIFFLFGGFFSVLFRN